MITNNTKDSVKLLESINFIDSSLFGFSIDIFKLRILIEAGLSSSLKDYGLNKYSEDLQCDFRLINNLQIKLNKSIFGPPYDLDGELSSLSLGDFTFEPLEIIQKGVTESTNREGYYDSCKPVYYINLKFNYGSIEFEFAELTICLFDPETRDI